MLYWNCVRLTRSSTREVLHRLHEQLDALKLGEFGLEAADHLGGAQPAFLQRLEVDEDAPAVEAWRWSRPRR